MENTEYICPICAAIRGEENDTTWIKQADIFYENDTIVGFISSKSIKGNEGHPLIVPKEHYKDLYALSENIGADIFSFSKKLATALKKV